MNGTLVNATPAQLRSTAQSFSDTGSTVSSLTSQMTSLVQGLSSVWSGEAATAYVSKFNQLGDDIQLLIKMIQEHSSDLQAMATEYETAETENEEIIKDLSGDVIS